MKRNLLIILLSLVLPAASAQDYIVKVNGEEIPARVLEVTIGEVLYHSPDSVAADTLRIPKSEVFMVRFENGTKEVFAQSLSDSGKAAEEVLSPDHFYLLGRQDALKYYKGNGVMWGSAGITALLFPYGLAGAALLGFTPPEVQPDKVSDVALLSNQDYMRGYEAQAKKKRRQKALAGAGIGTAAVMTVTAIAVAAVLSTW